MNKGSIVEQLCSDLDRKEPRYKCPTLLYFTLQFNAGQFHTTIKHKIFLERDQLKPKFTDNMHCKQMGSIIFYQHTSFLCQTINKQLTKIASFCVDVDFKNNHSIVTN